MIYCDKTDIFDPETYNLNIERVTIYHDFLSGASGYISSDQYDNTYGESAIADEVVEAQEEQSVEDAVFQDSTDVNTETDIFEDEEITDSFGIPLDEEEEEELV